MKNSKEILEILTRISNLPKKDAIKELKSLKLKFDEWQMLTNEDLGFVRYIGDLEAKGYKSKFESKVNISYEEYLNMKKLPVTREIPKDRNIARKESRREGISEEDVMILQKIEKLWDDLVVKYNPIEEAKRAVLEAQMIIEAGIDSEYLEVNLEDLKKDIEQYKKSITFIEGEYEKDEETRYFENGIMENMEYCLSLMTDIKLQMNDLTLDKFIKKFDINKRDFLEYFKEKLELIEKQPEIANIIRSREGKGFKLKEDGKIDITDENIAKELIGDKHFKEFTQNKAKKLSEIDEYEIIINKLPSKDENQVEDIDKEDEELEKKIEEKLDNNTNGNNEEEKEKEEEIERILEMQRAIEKQEKQKEEIKRFLLEKQMTVEKNKTEEEIKE